MPPPVAIAPASGGAPAATTPATIILEVPMAQRGWLETRLVPAAAGAGLAVAAFRATALRNHSIFVSVTASEARLLQEAHRLGFVLLLDADALREADRAINVSLTAAGVLQFPEGQPLLIRPVSPSLFMDSLWGGAPLDPYAYIHGPYRADVNGALYHTKRGMLSPTQALKLLLAVIESPQDLGGAGLNLEHLKLRGHLRSYFVLHDNAALSDLKLSWAIPGQMPWRQPLYRIKEYLGERVALFYAFLSFLTLWLAIPAMVGIGFFVYETVYGGGASGDAYLVICGAFFVSIWSTLTLAMWKRQQAHQAMRWGMTHFRQKETLRPAFLHTANRAASPITGRIEFYDTSQSIWYRARLALTSSVVSSAIGAVVVIIGCIFILQVTLVKHDSDNGGPLQPNWPSYITSVVNSVQIQITNLVYSWMAVWLCTFENHTTQSKYDASLTTKLALFQGINSYFALFYIAVKPHLTIAGVQQQCSVAGCMYDLEEQIAILMLVKFILYLALDVGYPVLSARLRRWWIYLRARSPQEKQALRDLEASASEIERVAALLPFDDFGDYLATLILAGYVWLFVSAFTLAPCIALVLLYLSLRGNTLVVLRLSSRPMPESAQDIGAWMSLLEALSFLSTFTNLAIVVFTDTSASIFGQPWTWQQRLIFFVVAEHIVLVIKFLLRRCIPEMSFATRLQLDRQRYLVNKHIFRLPEPMDTVAVEEKALAGGLSTPKTDAPSRVGGSLASHASLIIYDSFEAMAAAAASLELGGSVESGTDGSAAAVAAAAAALASGSGSGGGHHRPRVVAAGPVMRQDRPETTAYQGHWQERGTGV